MEARRLEFAKPTLWQTIRSFVGTCVFFFMVSLLGLVLGLTYIPYLRLTNFAQRIRSLDPMFLMCDWMSRNFFDIKWEIVGENRFPDTPCVALCKHQSTWETLVINRLHIFTIIAKKELAMIPIWGWAFASSGCIIVDRSKPAEARKIMNEESQDHMKHGVSVLLFPEGTRSAPGEVGNYRTGGAMIAEHTGAPIVPIALDSGYYWPRRSWIKYPGTVRIAIGDPIYPTGDWRKDTEVAKEWIEDTISSWDLPAHVQEAPASQDGA